jgi:hypothetical protein
MDAYSASSSRVGARRPESVRSWPSRKASGSVKTSAGSILGRAEGRIFQPESILA